MAQEAPGQLLLLEGPGRAGSREPWHVCPSSSGEGSQPASLSHHSQQAGLPLALPQREPSPPLHPHRASEGPLVSLFPSQERAPGKPRLNPRESETRGHDSEQDLLLHRPLLSRESCSMRLK